MSTTSKKLAKLGHQFGLFAIALTLVTTIGAIAAPQARADAWHDRGRHARDWHHRYYGPGGVLIAEPPPVVYAPAPVVYAPPPPSPGISLIVPLHIR